MIYSDGSQGLGIQDQGLDLQNLGLGSQAQGLVSKLKTAAKFTCTTTYAPIS